MTVESHKSESLYHDALAAFSAEKHQLAIDILEQSLAQAVHYKTYELLAVCMSKVGRNSESLHALERAHELNPRSTKTACLLAQSLLERHEVERAKAILGKVLQVNPSYGPATRLLAECQN